MVEQLMLWTLSGNSNMFINAAFTARLKILLLGWSRVGSYYGSKLIITQFVRLKPRTARKPLPAAARLVFSC